MVKHQRYPWVFIPLSILATTNVCLGQQLPVSRDVEKAYKHGTRDKTGLPGKSYWQNTADYQLAINFIPSARKVKGTVRIDYTNNSPDTLKMLLFKLYPNLYKAGAMRNMPVAPEDIGDGVRIISLTIDKKDIDSIHRVVKGTNMYIKNCVIIPGQKAHIDVSFEYTLNKGSFIRTGQIDTGAFFIAYFFPRLAVYDDLDGWNELPYLGKEEFYNDYGNFHVGITVPGNYQVWATGDLKNARRIYTSAILDRITHAETTDGITDIVNTKDLQDGNIMQHDSSHTWIFEAPNVTDFAFATSNHYSWKSGSVMVDAQTKRRTRVDAVFNPTHETYLPVAAYAKKTVELISNTFPKIPFPYSHETVFEGLDAMEYPMMVNNLPFKDPKDVIEFTAHEVFHSLFPFYVANNETRFSFMDEGWATFSEMLFHPLIDSTIPVDYDISPVNLSAGTDEDVPVMTPTPQLYGKARFADKDLKPALAYRYLNEMLGDRLFEKAIQHYIKTWAGRHPTPFDFFNCMNTGSGVNLDWFWKNWFFEKNVPDLAISKVHGDQLNYSVTVSSPGTLYIPVHLIVVYQNDSRDIITRKIFCWANGTKSIDLHFKAKMKVRRIILGNNYDVDINPADNVWN